MNNLLMMSDKDNVAVCLADGRSGETVTLTAKDGSRSGETVTLTAKDGSRSGSLRLIEEIPFAHKVALADIAPGEHIIKYGEIIGIATQFIKTGKWVHVHNIKGLRGKGDS
jgi:altronate dehydratase small subunit